MFTGITNTWPFSQEKLNKNETAFVAYTGFFQNGIISTHM